MERYLNGLLAKIKHIRGELSAAFACWAQIHALAAEGQGAHMRLASMLRLAQDPERGAGEFLNLMTARLEPAGGELGELAAERIRNGDWPWSFFCYPEERPRPVFPSSFTLLTAAEGTVGVAVRCPSCRRLSLNLVSQPHVDLPFHNDREIGVVEHMFAEDALATLEEFQAELWSTSFDARRLALR